MGLGFKDAYLGLPIYLHEARVICCSYKEVGGAGEVRVVRFVLDCTPRLIVNPERWKLAKTLDGFNVRVQ